jgi:hypothetical protein
MHASLTAAYRPAGGLAPMPLGPPSVAALEARQLRLLAYAVGDHLPLELALEVEQLEARRRALLAAAALA